LSSWGRRALDVGRVDAAGEYLSAMVEHMACSERKATGGRQMWCMVHEGVVALRYQNLSVAHVAWIGLFVRQLS